MATEKVTYAIVRIDTDKDVKEIADKIQSLENEISCLTMIDVYGFRTVPKQADEDGMFDRPVLYWP